MSLTISQLYNNPATRGEITVKKEFSVPLDRIRVVEGFNVKNEIYRDVVDGFKKSYLEGRHVPKMVVEATPDGWFDVIEGHHRHAALGELVAEGHEFRRITVEGFSGTEADKVALMVTSSQGRNLTPVERSAAYARLVNTFGWSRKEIADKFLVSLPSVTHHLAIAELTDVVKGYINQGRIAADLALEIYRKSGTPGVIAAVEGSGEKKATRKSVSAWRPAMGKSVVSVLSSVKQWHDPSGTVEVSFTSEQWAVISDAIAAMGDTGAKDKE